MNDSLQRVLDDLDGYTAAAIQLRDSMERIVAWNAEDAAYLRAGNPMGASMRRADSASRSREITRVLDGFEQARRHIRSSVTALLLEDGATVAEVGEAFGVSRQLAHRFAKDQVQPAD